MAETSTLELESSPSTSTGTLSPSNSTSSSSTIIPEASPSHSPSPLPDFPSLSLTLSRDQGTHHTSGSGAGSESQTLSHPADAQHELLAAQYLPLTKKSTLVSHALKPDLPRWKAGDSLEGGTSGTLSGSGVSTPDLVGLSGGGDGGISSTNATPGISRMGTPTPTLSSSDTTPGTATPLSSSSSSSSATTTSAAAAAAAAQQQSTPPTTGVPILAAVTPNGTSVPPSMNSTPSTTSVTTTSSATTTTSAKPATVAQVPAKPVEKEKKSVFGKLFERNNHSSTSVNAGSSNTSNGHSGNGVSSEKMERGDSNTTTSSSVGASAAGGAGGASLARKPSKKEKEQAEKERKAEISRASSISRSASTEGRPRSESQSRARAESGSNSYLSSSGNGMGAALNEFMKNKISRKSSVNSKKSDDGKSERGDRNSQGENSQYGGSTKGGSTKGGSTKGDDSKSRSGQTTASLLKKYGVCEKVAIGKGATAVVKLAHKWDRTTERLYAVKEFRKRRKNETEKEYVKKLTSEFCISSTLHHHNIVETVDLVQDEQSHWCEVMEYCPGGDLYAAIKKGNMSSPEINSYFKQIISGVTYLHSMGVAHRDIKPENLLLDAKGHVKITDFGVSDVFRMCWEKTTHLSKGLCGSEPYIAPEQFEVKEYDARQVDVWACAVVFYCMHFQELPWRVAKPTDPTFGPYVQSYAGSASPAPISNLVPRECRTIIKKMLDPDPKTRATTETIALDPWFIGIVVVPPLDGVVIAPVIPLPPLV